MRQKLGDGKLGWTTARRPDLEGWTSASCRDLTHFIQTWSLPTFKLQTLNAGYLEEWNGAYRLLPPTLQIWALCSARPWKLLMIIIIHNSNLGLLGVTLSSSVFHTSSVFNPSLPKCIPFKCFSIPTPWNRKKDSVLSSLRSSFVQLQEA